MEDTPKLGRLLPDSEKRRDAIHIALAPAKATVQLDPGQPVQLAQEDDMEAVRPAGQWAGIGIVDPFLSSPVKEGERFWLCLYQNTITSLRHTWTHPVYQEVAAKQREQLLGGKNG